MISKYRIIIAWVLSIPFVLAALWGYISIEEFPLAGYRKMLNEFSNFSIILIVCSVLLSSTWISIKKYHTKERWFQFEGACLILIIIGYFYVGLVYGATFTFFMYTAHVGCENNA